MSQPGTCPQCASQLVSRPAAPAPVALQAVFGVSFVAFLALAEKLKTRPAILWGWCGAQVVLGVLLVRARLRSRRRVSHCIKCHPDLRSSDI